MKNMNKRYKNSMRSAAAAPKRVALNDKLAGGGNAIWHRLLKSAGLFEDFRKLTVNVIVIVGALLGLAVVIKATFTPIFYIEPISIPKELSDRGYTGDGLAARMRAEVNEIQRLATTSRRNTFLQLNHEGNPTVTEQLIIASLKADNAAGSPKKFDVAVGSVSLSVIVSYIRDLFGYNPIVISGEIIVQQNSDANSDSNKNKNYNNFSMNLRISGIGIVHRESDAKENIDALFQHASLHLIERLQPYIAASYYSNKYDYDNAERMVTKCLQADENDMWALNLRGIIARARKNLDEAIIEYEDIIRRFPQFPLPYYNLANVLIDKKRYAKALNVALDGIKFEDNPVRKAIGYNSAGLALLQMGAERREEAISFFKKSMNADPQYAFASVNFIENMQEREQTDRVIEAYRKAALAASQPSYIYLSWGRYFRKIGRVEEARKQFEKAIDLQPEAPETHNLVGLLDLAEGKWKNAADQFRLAVKWGQRIAPYHYNLGRALRGIGELDEATKSFETATKLDSNHAWSFAQWGGTLAEKARQQPESLNSDIKWAVIDKLETAVATLPDNRLVRREVGLAYEMLDIVDLAIENFEVAIAGDDTGNTDLRKKIDVLRIRPLRH